MQETMGMQEKQGRAAKRNVFVVSLVLAAVVALAITLVSLNRADAAGAESSVTLGTSALDVGDCVFFGKSDMNTSTVWKLLSKSGNPTTTEPYAGMYVPGQDPIYVTTSPSFKRADGSTYNGSALFMITDNLYANGTYDTSLKDAQEKNFINGNSDLNRYILKTSKAEALDSFDNQNAVVKDEALTDVTMFYPSARELDRYLGSDKLRAGEAYWTRTLGGNAWHKDNEVYSVNAAGRLAFADKTSSQYARPAMNLDPSDVLYTRYVGAASDSSTGIMQKDNIMPQFIYEAVTSVDAAEGSYYELTFKDPTRQFKAQTVKPAYYKNRQNTESGEKYDRISAPKGTTVQLSYSGAQVGTDYRKEFISAMIVNGSGKVVEFGYLTEASSSGTVNVLIPNTLTDGDYQLLLFNNQTRMYNSQNQRYAMQGNLSSDFVKFDLHVYPRATVTAPEPNDFIYTGTAPSELNTYPGYARGQELLKTSGTTNGGELIYKYNNRWYSGWQNPSSTQYGDYEITYVAIGDDTHSDSEPQTITTHIKRAPISPTWFSEERRTVYYNGQVQTYLASSSGNETYGNTVRLTYDENNNGRATEAGDYTTKVTGVDNPNFEIGDNYVTENLSPRKVFRAAVKERTWKILPQPFDKGAVDLGDQLVYNGTAQSPNITGVRMTQGQGMNLQASQYSVTGNTGTNAGTYTMTLSPTDTKNFEGTLQKQFTINKLDISTANVKVTLGNTLTYNGAPQTQTVDKVEFTTADNSTVVLDPDKDYEVLENTQTNAGNHELIVKAKDSSTNFTGEYKQGFRIEPKNLSGAQITLNEDVQTYDGTVQEKGIARVQVGDLPNLGANDYTIKDNSNKNKNAGTYTITIEGQGNFKGQATTTYSINKRTATIEWEGTEGLVFDGNEKKISAKVGNACSGDTVDVTYSEDSQLTGTQQGTYTATVNGLKNNTNDNYVLPENGEGLTKQWSIAAHQNQFTKQPTIQGWTYGSAANAPSAEAQFGTENIQYAYTQVSGETDGFASEVPTQAGDYYMRATVPGTDDYSELVSEPVPFTISPLDITGKEQELSIDAFGEMTYNEKDQTPIAEVKLGNDQVQGDWSSVKGVDDTTTFTAKGNHSGTIKDKPTGMKKMNIGDANVKASKEFVYNGQEQTPEAVVTLQGFSDVAFRVTGDAATNVKTDGDYALKVEGTDNFEGTAEGTWNITPAEPKVSNDKKPTARVFRGKTLRDAAVNEGEMLGVGGEVLAGTFAWANDTQVMSVDGDANRVFTPEDANYTKVTFPVPVIAYTSEGTDIDTDGDGKPDLNIDTDGDGNPDLNVDNDKDGEPDTNIVDKDGDGKPDKGIDPDSGTKPDVNIDTDGDGKPDLNIDNDKDGKPDTNIVDKDDDGKPDQGVDPNSDTKPDVNIDTDGDGNPDLNVDTDGDGKPDVNIVDKDGDGKPDKGIDPGAGVKPDVNIDTNNDGKPDLNIDTNGDGKPDLNIDTDGDGKADLNIDTNGDGKPDLNIDTDGDGKADLNIDLDGDGKPDLNIDLDGDGKPDLNIDTNGDGKADLNIDVDGDGIADLNIDTDGDGIADKNIDADGDGKVDEPDGKTTTTTTVTTTTTTGGKGTSAQSGDTPWPWAVLALALISAAVATRTWYVKARAAYVGKHSASNAPRRR